MIRRYGLVAALLCASAGTAAAQNIVGRVNGLAASDPFFDFNSLPAIEGQSIASLTSAGVTVSFQGAYYGVLGPQSNYGPFLGSFTDNALYNFRLQSSEPLMVLDFTGAPTRGVAFNFTTEVDPGIATQQGIFTAFKGGVQVGIIKADFPPTSPGSRLFWGFEFANSTFDRVTIQGNIRAFGIDNLQVAKLTTTVPEPSTVGLMALGLAGVAVVIRRRRSSH